MEKSKVISIRIPKALLARLDEIADEERWYKRNTIIVKVLWIFVNFTDKKTRYDIIRWWLWDKKDYKLSFTEVDSKAKK